MKKSIILFFIFLSNILFSQQSQNIWTWIGGGKTANAPIADYGLVGIEHPDNYPNPSEYNDGVPVNNNFYFFGGGRNDAGETNLFWKFNNETQNWVYESGIFLEEEKVKEIVFDLNNEDYRNTPRAKVGVQLWKDSSDNIWLFSGFFNMNGFFYPNYFYEENLNDLWKYNTQSKMWSKVQNQTFQNEPNFGIPGIESSENQPPLTAFSQTWTTPDGYLWMFGGITVGEDTYKKHINTMWRFNPETQMWTCMSGPRDFFDLGSYGELGVESSLNYPPSRKNAATWVDDEGNLWLFGGNVATSYHPEGWVSQTKDTNEIWKYNPQTNLWTWVKGDLDSVETFPNVGVENINNMPAVTGVAKPAYWIDENGHLWYYYTRKLWEYNLQTNIWTLRKSLTSWSVEIPDDINVYNENYDPNNDGTVNYSSLVSNQSWVYNGEFYLWNYRSFWKYNPGLNAWSLLKRPIGDASTFKRKVILDPIQTEFTHPGSYYGSSAKWNDSQGNLWFYHKWGLGYNNTEVETKDIWKYDVSTLKWQFIRSFDFDIESANINYGQLGVEEYFNYPGRRDWALSWTDEEDNLWLYGGQISSNTMKSDLWKFNPNTKNWVWMDGPTSNNEIPNYGIQNQYNEENTPGGRKQAVTWKDLEGNFYIFSGYGYVSQGNQSNLNDIWKYNKINGQWAWLKGKNNNDTPEFSAGIGVEDENNQPIGGRDYTSWNDHEGNLWVITSSGGLWRFNNENWIQMTENSTLNYGLIGSYHENNSPGIRHNASSWVEENGSLLLFGGSEDHYFGPNENYHYNDLWRFDINLKQWAWIGGEKHLGNYQDAKYGIYGVLNEPFITNLPGVRQKTLFWQDNDKNYYLYGGNGLGESPSGGHLSDVWKLNRTFNVISGEIKIDMDGDGCQNSNLSMSNAKINVQHVSDPHLIFTNHNGGYIEVNDYTDFSLVPEADYFTFQPLSADFSFELVGNSLTQNFCAVGNGTFNDLNISVIPLTDPVSGFINRYKILYKNVGTTILSGDVQLEYQSNYMNFINSTPHIDSQTENTLYWNFDNLAPYQSAEILLELEFNAPTDPEFPLNNGDELNFLATVNPIDDDETAEDNKFTLTQYVVNSFDPNDKICLQGTSISPEEVGEFVYYKIRFENTGTATASHVVITDYIDTEKFDISSISPVDASNDFSFNIYDGNKLTITFEYINLPPPPSQNRFGYIVFKIRTKETLQEGDLFSNTANIYFDYNYPVITNEYETIIENNLELIDHNSHSEISVYPNPVEDIIYFNSRKDIDKVQIFDISGKLIQSNSVKNQKLEVKNLNAGIYIFKLYSDNSVYNLKIIKK